jgi:sec-independent protein translocase protein TatB
MFDIGFSELLLIGVVALVVIGPEKLPRVARTLGHLAGRLQRYVTDVKADINREMEFEDLRKMRDSLQQSASSFETSVQTQVSQAESDFKAVVEEKPAADHPASGDPKPEEAKPEETKPA